MCSPSRNVAPVLVAMMLIAASTTRAATTQPSTAPTRVLHIAADPNNLPFSNDRLEGFENKIAQIIATDLGATIDYTWWAQRRGFFRDAVKHGTSDIVLGVPADLERVIPTRPYYRSTYVFLSRNDRKVELHSFDDPILRTLKIGIPLVGGGHNSPPGQALANRGIIDNVVGYSVYADYREREPMARIVSDVASGAIDVAIVWGPLAGYFGTRQDVAMKITPVNTATESSTPFAYDICVGVKRGNPALKDEINAILARRKVEIDKVLVDYGVPLLDSTTPTTNAAPNLAQDKNATH